jgi:hypothetical protein
MTTVEMIQLFSSVKEKLPDLVENSIDQTSDTIVELNQQQMAEGVASDGETIHWLKDSHYPYTKPYAAEKARLGLQTEVVDLKLTGSFYKAERVKLEGDNLDFYNEDSKAEFLEKNYGKQIHGLTDENKKTYSHGVFCEALKTGIEAATGYKFI